MFKGKLIDMTIYRWGCKHEESGRRSYEMQHHLSHSSVQLKPAGFRISTTHPFVGASPDGYVSCSCCGTGIIEIKCPFCKGISVNEATNQTGFCLEKDEAGTLRLKRDHAYYYQVQMQLFVTNKQRPTVTSLFGLRRIAPLPLSNASPQIYLFFTQS